MWRVGTVPYRSIKERGVIAKKLKKDHGKVFIEVHDDFIMYRYKESLGDCISYY